MRRLELRIKLEIDDTPLFEAGIDGFPYEDAEFWVYEQNLRDEVLILYLEEFIKRLRGDNNDKAKSDDTEGKQDNQGSSE